MNHLRTRLSNRDGIALPVAIFGLILLSVLITGVLLSATTESALSFAHRDATQDLYAAEGAIQAYVGRQNDLPTRETIEFLAPGASQRVRISVERQLFIETVTSPTEQARSTFYSIAAQPVGGGRTIVGIVPVRQQLLSNLNLGNVDAAFTLGGDAKIGQNQGQDKNSPKIDDGTNASDCDPSKKASKAITWSNDADVTFQNKAEQVIQGYSGQDEDRDSDALISHVLGGMTMRDLAWNADVKFGSYFGKGRLGNKKVSGSNTGKDASYNWGCPGALETRKGQGCGSALVPRIVAIDAENSEVKLDDYHGAGMLIVINGSLRIAGSFVYKGLVLVERDVQFVGGGNTDGTIEGAVIAAGKVVVDAEGPVDADESKATGHTKIYFNRCALEMVQDAFNDTSDGQNWSKPSVLRPVGNWLEVVR